MSSGVRELRVWQESVALAGEVVRAARHGMRRETRIVTESLMATAVLVATHIADGYGRNGLAEQRDAYHLSKRALLRLETELAIAKQCDLIPSGAFSDLTSRSGQVSRLLTGYLVYLDRMLAEGTPATPSSAARGETSITEDAMAALR